MDANPETQLKCPTCGSTERFSITAEISITVSGADYLTVEEEDGDREYGSESTCVCKECGHRGNMGEFLRSRPELTSHVPITDMPDTYVEGALAVLVGEKVIWSKDDTRNRDEVST